MKNKKIKTTVKVIKKPGKGSVKRVPKMPAGKSMFMGSKFVMKKKTKKDYTHGQDGVEAKKKGKK